MKFMENTTTNKTLIITIADTKAEFKIDLDTDRELDVTMQFDHRKVSTTLMGFLSALGLITIVEIPTDNEIIGV
jgi:hypothetical protein